MRRILKDFIHNKWLLVYSICLFAFIIGLALLMLSLLGKYDEDLSNYEVVQEYALDVTKILGIITLIITIYHLGLNRKKLNFDVIDSCISRFHEIMADINEAERKMKNSKTKNNPELEDALQLYVELVNEELFYIAYDYIPTEVAREWIDGMVSFLPVLDKDDEIINKKHIFYPDQLLDIVKLHPRVFTCFRYDGDIEAVYSKTIPVRVKARKRIVKQIMRKITWFSY